MARGVGLARLAVFHNQASHAVEGISEALSRLAEIRDDAAYHVAVDMEIVYLA